MEIPRWTGVLKARILEAKYEAEPEFPEGMGAAKQKTFCEGKYGYFLELRNLRLFLVIHFYKCRVVDYIFHIKNDFLGSKI